MEQISFLLQIMQIIMIIYNFQHDIHYLQLYVNLFFYFLMKM